MEMGNDDHILRHMAARVVGHHNRATATVVAVAEAADMVVEAEDMGAVVAVAEVVVETVIDNQIATHSKTNTHNPADHNTVVDQTHFHRHQVINTIDHQNRPARTSRESPVDLRRQSQPRRTSVHGWTATAPNRENLVFHPEPAHAANLIDHVRIAVNVNWTWLLVVPQLSHQSAEVPAHP